MAKYKLLLPRMGESVAEATIIKWNKQIGDLIEIDDTVIDIATDKVDSEVPSPVKGRLDVQLCKENEVVQVGAVLGIIETDEEVINISSKTGEATTDKITSDSHEEEFFPPSANSAYKSGPVFDDQDNVTSEILPDKNLPLPGMELLNNPSNTPIQSSGARFYSPLVKNIANQEGISPQEMDAIPGTGAEGRLTKDDVLLYLKNRKPGYSEIKKPSDPAPAPHSPRPSELLEQPKHAAMPAPPQASVQPQASGAPKPAAVAHQPVVPAPVIPVKANTPDQSAKQSAGIPPVQSTASTANETQQPKNPTQGGSSAKTNGGDEIIEMDRMRRLIAEHMVASVHTSPHVTSFVEADVTNMVLWRDKVKAAFEKREGTKITYTPIFIEAVAKAIKDFPMINVSVNGTQIIKKKDVNIGMAAALPSGNLIVPVIRRANELNLVGLSKAVNDLAARARTSKLQPDEIRDGTFTITNIGSFGNAMGTPIINQPQVAILAVGVIKKKPAVIETVTGDVIAIRHMMFLSLSYDHRVVDGALGGSFIRRVADYLENWDLERDF